MKTAISIPDDLFRTVQVAATELNLSRSRVFADAVREYIERLSNKKIVNTLNEVYADAETESEAFLRRQRKRYYAGTQKREPW